MSREAWTDRSADVPLVVEIQGPLIRGDPRWERAAHLLLRNPGRLFRCLLDRLNGGARDRPCLLAAKARGLRRADLHEDLLRIIEARVQNGGRVILISWEDSPDLEDLAARIGAEAVSTGHDAQALDPDAVSQLLRSELGTFDYLGAGHRDIPLWAAARRRLAFDASRSVVRSARADGLELEIVAERKSRSRTFLQAIRPHQWMKNGLLLLPALAAHLTPTTALTIDLFLGFLSFSSMASAVYLLNDLADVREDRLHPAKRHRPIASGSLSVPGALGGAVGLVAGSGILAVTLHPTFGAILLMYAVLSSAYSMGLKRVPILDVILLATLYTARVLAGAAVAGVALSRWFIAFSVFFFFSLALVKRLTELQGAARDWNRDESGRGYLRSDVPVILSLGGGAVAASSLVYCQYILGPSVADLYSSPDVLWLGLPLLLFWHARMWLLAHRGRIDEDPVVFALHDPTGYSAFAGFLLVMWIAS